MTANDLLDIAEDIDAHGLALCLTDLRHLANLHNDPQEAMRMYLAECGEPHPSLTAAERNL